MAYKRKYFKKKQDVVDYKYTVIDHDYLRKLGLSLNHYAAIDLISQLQFDNQDGWCTASKRNIAEFFGMTKQGFFWMLNTFVEKGYVEIHEETRNIRVVDEIAKQLWQIQSKIDSE